MAVVTVSNRYPATASVMWDIATDFECFTRAMARVATFRKLPEGPLEEGQTIRCEVSLFGVLPWRPHQMHLKEFRAEDHGFLSIESGPGIARWDHRLTITATEDGCELTDTIDLEASPRVGTPILAAWARYCYRARHAPRLAMINERTPREA